MLLADGRVGDQCQTSRRVWIPWALLNPALTLQRARPATLVPQLMRVEPGVLVYAVGSASDAGAARHEHVDMSRGQHA